jgi:hypothetical protein
LDGWQRHLYVCCIGRKISVVYRLAAKKKKKKKKKSEIEKSEKKKK